MSRFSELIEELEDLQQQDIKNSAKVFSITASLSTRLHQLLDAVETSNKALPKSKITKEELIKRYGSYNNAYAAYKKAYGIKCKGWDRFLQAIEGLSPPTSLEERVEKLEETVKLLVKILIENETKI
ncbi:hypothetical protein cce_0326 [Crocosphaera subtropica ATCC 51142]|uniref:Uncharacterized protein n=1 Tax=Crocosphaera subtropica (strain ATCC 51142 / BH68) TaxID=43989 RepID=B1X136_CROS5|nr:hypothetical protein [Crocosphaera subtropica]ACB49677.1 hypothetical protein cce_0326 [Crocosphaera subtropica ATCC 51142]